MILAAVFSQPTLGISISGQQLGATTGTPVARDYVNAEAYEGDYTITPGDEPQVLSTKNKRMTDDVTIGAIPSNYGKITWNGNFLTVS